METNLMIQILTIVIISAIILLAAFYPNKEERTQKKKNRELYKGLEGFRTRNERRDRIKETIG
jgi:hypothetical protein